jgi:hypothetical protein
MLSLFLFYHFLGSCPIVHFDTPLEEMYPGLFSETHSGCIPRQRATQPRYLKDGIPASGRKFIRTCYADGMFFVSCPALGQDVGECL